VTLDGPDVQFSGAGGGGLTAKAVLMVRSRSSLVPPMPTPQCMVTVLRSHAISTDPTRVRSTRKASLNGLNGPRCGSGIERRGEKFTMYCRQGW